MSYVKAALEMAQNGLRIVGNFFMTMGFRTAQYCVFFRNEWLKNWFGRIFLFLLMVLGMLMGGMYAIGIHDPVIIASLALISVTVIGIPLWSQLEKRSQRREASKQHAKKKVIPKLFTQCQKVLNKKFEGRVVQSHLATLVDYCAIENFEPKVLLETKKLAKDEGFVFEWDSILNPRIFTLTLPNGHKYKAELSTIYEVEWGIYRIH